MVCPGTVSGASRGRGSLIGSPALAAEAGRRVRGALEPCPVGEAALDFAGARDPPRQAAGDVQQAAHAPCQRDEQRPPGGAADPGAGHGELRRGVGRSAGARWAARRQGSVRAAISDTLRTPLAVSSWFAGVRGGAWWIVLEPLRCNGLSSVTVALVRTRSRAFAPLLLPVDQYHPA